MTHGFRTGSAKWQDGLFGCGRAFHGRFVVQEYRCPSHSRRRGSPHDARRDTGCQPEGSSENGRKRNQHGLGRRAGRLVQGNAVILATELFQGRDGKTSSQTALPSDQKKLGIRPFNAKDPVAFPLPGLCWISQWRIPFLYLPTTSVDSSPINGSVIDSLATLRRSR